jgi:Tol biopolymer transport system component
MVTVSPAGNAIAFVIDGEHDFIRTLNLQTGIQEDVLVDTRYDFRSPYWSPNGQYFAYSRANVNSALPFGSPGQIYLLETPFDSNVGSQLTDHDDRAYFPTWSPDSISLAYILATAYGDELWVAEINTRETKKLTNFVPCQRDPSWSPDSLELAFTSSHNNNNWDIYVASTDTGSPHNITNSPSDQEFNPAWSPDGQYIVYIKFIPTSTTTAEQELFLWDIQNSTEIRLTNTPTPETNPQWSPDGSKIAFLSTDVSRQWYLEIMNPDGTERTSLEAIGSR